MKRSLKSVCVPELPRGGICQVRVPFPLQVQVEPENDDHRKLQIPECNLDTIRSSVRMKILSYKRMQI